MVVEVDNMPLAAVAEEVLDIPLHLIMVVAAVVLELL
jgi:hypothetical protein